MDAPPIQYARTEDGVNIAYTVMGEGPPLVYLQPYTHQQLDWTIAEMAAWFEQLAQGRTLIRFDARRCGLSSHSAGPLSLGNFVVDLGAVVDRLALDELDLMGISGHTMTAIAFTAAHPERIRRLILWGGVASGGQLLAASDRSRAFEALVDIDPDLVRDLIVRTMFGDEGLVRPECQAHTEQALATGDVRAFLKALFQADTSEDLARIACPTLVVYPTTSFSNLEAQQALGSGVADGELYSCDAQFYPHRTDQPEDVARKLNEFLGVSPTRPSSAAFPLGFRTLLFTDLESSTALTQSLGDAKAQEVLRGHNDAVRTALEAHAGEEVKHTGDGIFAAFGSAVSAVEAALQIQRELAGAEVRVRVGLNAGEPIAEDDDYFGAAVQLAARVCDRAEPGQVLVSRVVMDLCAGKGFQFNDQGEASLKGFREQVRLFEVGAGESAPPRDSAVGGGPLANLTRRELDVLRLIAGGDTNQEIATTLGLSVRTVERHITNLYGKIDARGRADATTYALTHSLTRFEP